MTNPNNPTADKATDERIPTWQERYKEDRTYWGAHDEKPYLVAEIADLRAALAGRSVAQSEASPAAAPAAFDSVAAKKAFDQQFPEPSMELPGDEYDDAAELRAQRRIGFMAGCAARPAAVGVGDEIDHLAAPSADNATLRAAILALPYTPPKGWGTLFNDAGRELHAETLRAAAGLVGAGSEPSEVEKNAARWRFVREHPAMTGRMIKHLMLGNLPLDESVDAAIKSLAPTPPAKG